MSSNRTAFYGDGMLFNDQGHTARTPEAQLTTFCWRCPPSDLHVSNGSWLKMAPAMVAMRQVWSKHQKAKQLL